MNITPNVLNLILSLVLILSGFALGLIFEKRGIRKLKKITRRTGWKGYEVILDSLHGVILLWCVLIGVFIATFILPPNHSLLVVVREIILTIFLASATIFISRLAVEFIKLYSSKEAETSPFTSLLENLTRLLIISIGILIIIQSLGIAITPLLTALGIGGVSIGLALQNTLSNLFSGINIITSRKVRPGDYIKLDNGEEGYVIDIAWRHTVVREFTENLLVIPNAKLVGSTFKNYSLPSKEMLLSVEVGVSYDSDLEKVELVTLEVAKQVMKEVPGGVPEHEPFIRYNKYGYFSINFIVYLRVQEFIDHLIVKHEFIKRLHRGYRVAGIKIPFPIKTTYIPEEGFKNGQ